MPSKNALVCQIKKKYHKGIINLAYYEDLRPKVNEKVIKIEITSIAYLSQFLRQLPACLILTFPYDHRGEQGSTLIYYSIMRSVKLSKMGINK